MPLTEFSIRNAKAIDRPVKLFDGNGLYLLIHPNGSQWWRFKYRVAGREKLISFGTYPEVPLKAAREKREDARRLVAAGGDPSAKRKAERAARTETFEAIAKEWLELQAKRLGPRTYLKNKGRFEDFVFPYLGKTPIAAIKAPDLLAALIPHTAYSSDGRSAIKYVARADNEIADRRSPRLSPPLAAQTHRLRPLFSENFCQSGARLSTQRAASSR